MSSVEAFQASAALADRLDERTGRPGPVAQAWGLSRLALFTLALPVAAPVIGTVAARNTRRTIEAIARFPAELDALVAGAEAPFASLGTDTLDAGQRWFVASDLHRCVAGTLDWPRSQGAEPLYRAALAHYAGAGWGLVENGDVEDFWLAGGSAYGVAYDLFRAAGLARARLGRRRDDGLAVAVAREHLRRIVANNRATYDLIEDGFARRGRYRRTVGNHDDVVAHPEVVAALAEVHPGVAVHDAVVLRAGADPAAPGLGIITHGHHLDAWNAPTWSGLGRFFTWLGSALVDAPLLGNPGVPDPGETDGLLRGSARDRLVRVSRLFGADEELYSTDEVLLFEAARRRWGSGVGDLDDGPWLLLGHTHLPLFDPCSEDGGAWPRYVNAGCGILHEAVTGVEWDGLDAHGRPVVRLVVWHYADRHPPAVRSSTQPVGEPEVVGSVDDRAVARTVLDRLRPGHTLGPAARRPAATGGGPGGVRPAGAG